MTDAPFTLELRPHGGARYYDTCRTAQHIADVLRVYVAFVFNDVHCMALPDGSAEWLAQELQRLMSDRGCREMAQSIRRG